MEKQNIEEKYIALTKKYKSIIFVPPDKLKKIQGELDEYNNYHESIYRYYVVTTCAIFLIATAPYLISEYFSFSLRIKDVILIFLNKEEFLRNHIYIHVSCFLLLVAIPAYTLNMPVGILNLVQKAERNLKYSLNEIESLLKGWEIYKWFEPIFHRLKRIHAVKGEIIKAGEEKNIERLTNKPKTATFYVYAFFLNYIAILIPILYLSSFGLLNNEILEVLTIAWLMVLSPVFTIVPTFLLMVVLVFIRMKLARYVKYDKFDHLPCVVIDDLMSLIDYIDKSKFNQPYANNEKNEVEKSINKISKHIFDLQRLYPSKTSCHLFVRRRFERSAIAFRGLILHVALPQPDSVAQLRRAMLRILNIFLAGNFWNLPEFTFSNPPLTINDEKTGVLIRAISFIGLVAFLLLPIACWIFFVVKYQLVIDEVSKTLLMIVYSLWVVFGILSFSKTVETEVKESFVNILKVILAGK